MRLPLALIAEPLPVPFVGAGEGQAVLGLELRVLRRRGALAQHPPVLLADDRLDDLRLVALHSVLGVDEAVDDADVGRRQGGGHDAGQESQRRRRREKHASAQGVHLQEECKNSR